MRSLLAIVAITIAAGAALRAQAGMPQGQPSRDTRVAAKGLGEISGLIVTDEENPQPVKRAEVRAILTGGEPLTTYTDGAGASTFTNLPIGRLPG